MKQDLEHEKSQRELLQKHVEENKEKNAELQTECTRLANQLSDVLDDYKPGDGLELLDANLLQKKCFDLSDKLSTIEFEVQSEKLSNNNLQKQIINLEKNKKQLQTENLVLEAN